MTMKSVHKKSTKRITLRLHENILEILNNESDKRDLPINAIIGRILANYVKFDMNKNIIPTITMSQLLLSKILHRLNESEKKELFLQGAVDRRHRSRRADPSCVRAATLCCSPPQSTSSQRPRLRSAAKCAPL